MEKNKQFTQEQAKAYLKQKGKKSGRFYVNIFGRDYYLTLKPTFATPTGKAKGFPRTIIICNDETKTSTLKKTKKTTKKLVPISAKKTTAQKPTKKTTKKPLGTTKSVSNSITFKLSGMRYFDTAKDALVMYFLAKQKDFFYIDMNKKGFPFGFKTDGKVITTYKDKDNTYMLKITDYLK